MSAGHGLEYSFTFRYTRNKPRRVFIPIALLEGIEVSVYDVAAFVDGNDSLRAELMGDQLGDVEQWEKMADYYAKDLQRQGERLRVVWVG